jgi:GT2 family glycosyltransferase
VSAPHAPGAVTPARALWVVVLNWNGLADTRALLPTLAVCRMPPGWTLKTLVVDNGSGDGSVDALRREFPDIELLALGENRRFAGGNNPGIQRALERGAAAVMLLNNDTLVDPGLAEHLLRALEQDPGAGAVAPLIYFAAPSQRIWYAGGRCVPALGLTGHRGLRELDRGHYRKAEPTGYLTGCCLLAPRATWERVGMLDEGYFIYAEDADWSLRARAAGYRLLFVPTARLWHQVSASSGAASPFKIYHRLRANARLCARHARGVGRVTWPVAFLAQQLALMAWLFVRGKITAALAVPKALVDALAGRDPVEVRL